MATLGNASAISTLGVLEGGGGGYCRTLEQDAVPLQEKEHTYDHPEKEY